MQRAHHGAGHRGLRRARTGGAAAILPNPGALKFGAVASGGNFLTEGIDVQPCTPVFSHLQQFAGKQQQENCTHGFDRWSDLRRAVAAGLIELDGGFSVLADHHHPAVVLADFASRQHET